MQLLRDNVHLQHVMLKVQAHDRTLHTTVGKTAECPKVVWFYPKKPELRDWLSNPIKCLLQAPLMMVVVCPVTFCVVPCGPDGVGWEVAMPKKWVKEWGPAILFSIYVLQAAVVAGRAVGIPLPPMPDTKVVKEALGLKGMLGSAFSKGVNQANLSDSLSSFADTTKAALDLNPQLQSLCDGLKRPTAAGDGGQALPANLPMHLVGEAYNSIHKFLLTFGPLEDQLRGRMECVMAPDGDVEWVSVEGKEAWLKKHATMVTELQQQQQQQQQQQAPLPSPPILSAPAFSVSTCAAGAVNSWLALKLTARGMGAEQLTVCVRALVDTEGFTSEDLLAFLPSAEFHAEYLKGLGITAKGTQMQLISLHRELHQQYTAGGSSPTPSTSSATDTATLTPDEKARLLETQNTVQSLTAELKKLRAATAASSQQQQQSGGGGGGKGGLMHKQAQCNVVNPRTGQPYTTDELVAEIHLLQQQGARNADDIAGVAATTREGLEGLGWKG
jgi:type II secretory pathway pseudopilin PulG